MRRTVLAGALLAMSVMVSTTGCGDDDSEDGSADSASGPVDTPSASSRSPSGSGGYVARVNALCEAMIDKVMAVRGDEDGDGGGDFPSIDEFEEQELAIRSVHSGFDAEVDALAVSDADQAAADAFDAFRDTSDAEAEKLLTVARSGDEAEYNEALAEPPSAEFEAKRRAMNDAGIECPAR